MIQNIMDMGVNNKNNKRDIGYNSYINSKENNNYLISTRNNIKIMLL